MFLAKNLNTTTWSKIPVKNQLRGNNLNPGTFCSMKIPQGVGIDSYKEHMNHCAWEGWKQATLSQCFRSAELQNFLEDCHTLKKLLESPALIQQDSK